VVVCLGADFKRDELMRGCPWRGLAPRNEVRAWSPHRVLDNVGYEEREDHAYKPAEDRNVDFVCAGPDNDGPEDQEAEGDSAGVDEEPYYNTALAWREQLGE
jgi:hypothetical protein